ncbi:hypothetical protein KC675_01350 [Candidatus Dojkabacteria bacterium]|uniref:Uncharacterized protein n=1 Tax=Candidatus Dojkabacteria bacterium TaxID=2099670 RepID=A0A955L066_9BACT|nr:hypothetical protein [Candidatus Dojkabacteria bacterium]
MTNNLNEPKLEETMPSMETPIQADPDKTDGYNEAVKQGQTMKVVMVVVIFLILAVLVGYILMNFLSGDDEVEVVVPTVAPSVATTVLENEPLASPASAQVTYQDFSYQVFIPDTKDQPFTVSGEALSDAELIPVVEEDYAGFTIRGNGYQVNVGAYFTYETMSYEDFVSLMKVGDETVARVKDNYLMTPQHQYRYVRTENLDETRDCEGIGPDDMLAAPCGYSHYVRGNEVQTFYILDITCDADDENVSKCDDIVKSLQVSV